MGDLHYHAYLPEGTYQILAYISLFFCLLDPPFDVKPFTPAFWPKWGLPLDMQIPRHKALGGDQYSRAMSLQRLVDLVVPGGWLRVADGLGTGFVDFNLLLKSKVAEYNWGFTMVYMRLSLIEFGCLSNLAPNHPIIWMCSTIAQVLGAEVRILVRGYPLHGFLRHRRPAWDSSKNSPMGFPRRTDVFLHLFVPTIHLNILNQSFSSHSCLILGCSGTETESI